MCATLDCISSDRTLTAAVHREDAWFVAQCLEVDVASQGASVEEALANLREAVEPYLDEMPDPLVAETPVIREFAVPTHAA